MRVVPLTRPRRRWLACALALTAAAPALAGCQAAAGRTTTARDRLRADPHAVFRVRTRRPLVALTFDDGPDPRWTPAVLDLLAGRGIRATFFLVGRRALDHRDLVQAEVGARHEIGNHTFTHAHLELISPGGVEDEVEDGARALVAAGAPPPRLFRPPRGFTTRVVARVARQAQERTVFWGLTVERFIKRAAVGPATDRLVAQVRPGTIVLAHDGGGNRARTLQALPRLVAGLKARGFRFVTVSELLASGSSAPP
jgi:peptidoglycan/xylan/chitin deacetylase (PgdA/CDA1 family)